MSKDWDKSTLSSLRIHELRDLGRKLGVRRPTALTKEELIRQCMQILNGEAQPYKPINKKGRPAKENKFSTLVDILMPNNLQLDSYSSYSNNDEDDFDFCVNMPEFEYGTECDIVQQENAEGLVEITSNGFGVIRVDNFQLSNEDVFIHESLVKENKLKNGDYVVALVKTIIKNRPRTVAEILSINKDLNCSCVKEESEVFVNGVNKKIKRGESTLILLKELNSSNNALLEFEQINKQFTYSVYASAFEKGKHVSQPNKMFATVNPFKSYKDIFCCYNMAINRACVLSEYGSVVVVINLISAYYKAAETTIGNDVENNNKLTMLVKEEILKLFEKAKKHNVTLIIYDSIKSDPKITDYLQYELSKVVDNFES